MSELSIIERMTDEQRKTVTVYAVVLSDQCTVGPPYDDAQSFWYWLCAKEPEDRLRTIQRLLNASHVVWQMRRAATASATPGTATAPENDAPDA